MSNAHFPPLQRSEKGKSWNDVEAEAEAEAVAAVAAAAAVAVAAAAAAVDVAAVDVATAASTAASTRLVSRRYTVQKAKRCWECSQGGTCVKNGRVKDPSFNHDVATRFCIHEQDGGKCEISRCTFKHRDPLHLKKSHKARLSPMPSAPRDVSRPVVVRVETFEQGVHSGWRTTPSSTASPAVPVAKTKTCRKCGDEFTPSEEYHPMCIACVREQIPCRYVTMYGKCDRELAGCQFKH